MKEKIIELAIVHAKELGIKVIGLTGTALVKLADDLAASHSTRIIQADKINPDDLRKMREPLVGRPTNV